jgi:hypothetical protein
MFFQETLERKSAQPSKASAAPSLSLDGMASYKSLSPAQNPVYVAAEEPAVKAHPQRA